MAQARIRNLNCFRELQHFNDTGQWKGVHSFVVYKSDREKIEELFNTDSDSFLDGYHSCKENVKRYTSYIRNNKHPEKLANFKQRLEEHSARLTIFKQVQKAAAV